MKRTINMCSIEPSDPVVLGIFPRDEEYALLATKLGINWVSKSFIKARLKAGYVIQNLTKSGSLERDGLEVWVILDFHFCNFGETGENIFMCKSGKGKIFTRNNKAYFTYKVSPTMVFHGEVICLGKRFLLSFTNLYIETMLTVHQLYDCFNISSSAMELLEMPTQNVVNAGRYIFLLSWNNTTEDATYFAVLDSLSPDRKIIILNKEQMLSYNKAELVITPTIPLDISWEQANFTANSLNLFKSAKMVRTNINPVDDSDMCVVYGKGGEKISFNMTLAGTEVILQAMWVKVHVPSQLMSKFCA